VTYTNDQKLEFVAKRAQGLSFDKIAQDLGISKPTLLKWQGELYGQIREQEFYEVQNITECYRVMRRDRFATIAKLLSAVNSELTRRAETNDLADIPTDKLVNLALVLEKRVMQDTGRELVAVHTGDFFEDTLKGTIIDAD
jgi:transposase-like protein